MAKRAIARIEASVQEHLPLAPPVFHMLLALCQGERHGYALKREVLRRTDGKLNLGAGALYGSIARMVERGMVEETETRPDLHLDDERRRYYRITPLGRRVAQAEMARMRDLVQLAEDCLRLPGTV
jgi:DNA-binding PadR family transcriptional regulator